jgi:hypothetical protein
VDYAVGTAYRTQYLGDPGIVRATLADDPRTAGSGEVRIRFAVTPEGTVETRVVSTRKVLGTWADHEAAAVLRKERLREEAARRDSEMEARLAARAEIADILGQDPFATSYGSARTLTLETAELLRLLRLAVARSTAVPS